ncbi:Asparagine synthetase [glutamine-hydrolyzing] [hydrothermal vent metagenome]|uniref:Asparagine synthetase [glutamine-hydrolyzing] n=1 Tax=hydrothermal vent metagenome TaxID=652676 RepID=A0A3B0W2J1_9ZZZZ
MCGICGEIYWDGQPSNKERINGMLQAMLHRGPDDGGVWQKEHVGLGHRRLSIIDLSDAGHQPMLDKELTLVFNGCIYNYKALKKELEALGHLFQSNSDTEVILKAYRQWGMECVQYFEGMFAFAIWDDDLQQLLLARDRLGIKPLYYAPIKGGVRFASNTQALLTSDDIDTDIDSVGLHHQLTLHAVIPAPHTILKGIRKLEPGHWMIINPDGQMFKKSFWHLEATPFEKRDENPIPKTDSEWIDCIHEHLKEAVLKRLTAADVPVGVLLSGGLDSSLLVALLDEAGVKNIKTFSIGFEDAPEEKGNEFEFSDLVVERYQTDHQKILISNQAVLPRLHEAVEAMSEPMVGQDAIAFYLLSEQVSKRVKVVMSGQGADEVFGGYDWYSKMYQAGQGIDLSNPDEAVAAFAPYYFDRTHQEWLEVVNSKYHIEDVTSRLVGDRLTEGGANSFLDQVLRFDVTTLIVDDPVKRVDNMTMAWGLEARVPFLDHKLVEWAMMAPDALKIQGGGKFILKEIARGLVPDEIIDRPKVAFPMPALKYVRGDFYEFMKTLLTSPQAKARGIFNQEKLQDLLNNPEAKESFTAIQGSKLWHAALLEFWLQKHVDKTL